MKSALILLIAGLAGARQLYSPGQEYVYDYYGRMMTGIPELDSTFAGLALQGKVVLQATQQHSYKLQMKEVKFGTFNDHLTGPEPKNWRSVEVEPSTPLTGEYKQMLEIPVEFSVQEGEVTSLKVSQQEPKWSVNMKKAIVSSLKIQLPQQSSKQQQEEEERRSPRFWYIQQQEQRQQQQEGQNNLYVWTVMEEGIEGKCENTYQVTEIPEYMVHDYEKGMFQPELCQDKKFWQVLRTRDITKCTDRSVFLSSKGHKNCVVGNCETENSKQTQTRYFACGLTAEDMQLHGMINEGEMRQNVVAFNTESVVTGTKQVLKLQKIQSVSRSMPEIPSPKICKDLSFEYPLTSEKITSRQEQRETISQLLKESRTKSLISEMNSDSSMYSQSKLDTEQLKTRIVEKLQEIASQLQSAEHFAEKEIPSQLKALKTVVSVMSTEQIKQMFKMVKSISSSEHEKKIVRNLFIDIVRNSGTPATVMFITDAIKDEELTEMELYYTIVTMSHYLRYPTEEVIQEIFEMIKSPVIKKRSWLKSSAHLVFANIVRNACLGSSKTYYPEEVFGKMCTEKNEKIVSEYIPHLMHELKTAESSTEKRIALWSLGQMAHESVIPLLISYMEGKEDSSNRIRQTAMYALSDVTQTYRHKLLPVFLAVATNPAEARNLRIAAVAMIMKCRPETVQLQKLAVSTWFEQDQEVARFIYSMLKEQAQISREQHPQGSYLKELSMKAQTVLPLAKPLPMILSVTKISSGYLKDLEIGATMLNQIMSGSQSTEFYHQTEYFLKQVQTKPLEFSLHYAGLKSVARSLLESVSEQSRAQRAHPQLRDLLQRLDISPRQDADFEVGAWLRLSDDINFAAEFSHQHVEMLKSKVVKALKETGMTEIMDKICGTTPINHQNVFESIPYQSMVPSDLGFPIIVETQMTYFYGIQGQVSVECSYNKPSVSLEVANKMSYTYNGFAGTICPFTKELLAAGINIHRATNLPVKTLVQLQPASSQLKVTMQQNEQVSSGSQNIDIHHYHVKPYTVKKPLVFKDLTPTILHPNTKIIHSKATPKSYEANFGQMLGLDLSAKVETECDLYDAKTYLDSWANYHYNPMAASMFHFTETALTAAGKPSCRYHKYTMVHNPSRSATKGAELTVKLALASKQQDQEAKKYDLKTRQHQRLQQSSRSDQRLEDCLRKLEHSQQRQQRLEAGYAANTLISAKLLGGSEKTYTYSVTAAAGTSQQQHKWNLHLENDDEHEYHKQTVCIDGEMSYPTTYTSQARFQYSNNIGFGETCDQYHVKVEGETRVSNQQREYSERSDEAKRCQTHSQEEERLRRELRSTRGTDQQQRQSLQRSHAQAALKQMSYCDQRREQSQALDQTDFTISYSQNMPRHIKEAAKTLNTALKAVLFPYMSKVSSPSQTSKIQLQMYFQQKTNTMTLKLQSPQDNVIFRSIRIPQELKEVIPLVAGKSPIEQSYKAITGTPLIAKCVLGQGYVHTFDKKTYSYQIDECDHLIASDCSKSQNHAILAKEVNGQKHVTIYEGKTKIELRPSQSYESYVEEWTLKVDGEERELRKSEQVSVQVQAPLAYSPLSPYTQCTVYLHEDNVVEINTPNGRIIHKGKTVSVEEKSLMADGSHCGLCGDYNMDKRADVKSPKQCVLSSMELVAKSYRIKSDQCSPLSQSTSQKIRSEEEKCVKYSTKSTKVSDIYRSEGHRDSYSVRKHSYIYKEDKICISQDPVVQCARESVPQDIRKKSIKFVCLPEGRVAKLYQDRIERGESPQELKHQPVAFSAEMDQPVSCKPTRL